MPTTSAVSSGAVGMKNLPRARAPARRGQVTAATCQKPHNEATARSASGSLQPTGLRQTRLRGGSRSEVPVAGFGQRNLFPGGIDEADTSALLDIADRGYRQAKLLREAADLVGGVERSGKQQLVIVACGREARRQIGFSGGDARGPRTQPTAP